MTIAKKFADRIDMRFQYVPPASTDISKTFARERKRLAEQKSADEAAEKASLVNVRKIKGAK